MQVGLYVISNKQRFKCLFLFGYFPKSEQISYALLGAGKCTLDENSRTSRSLINDVECGIILKRVIRPHFFDQHLNGDFDVDIWFQQDGAPLHYAILVNWPARSFDLTPIDFFLWGFVNNLR